MSQNLCSSNFPQNSSLYMSSYQEANPVMKGHPEGPNHTISRSLLNDGVST